MRSGLAAESARLDVALVGAGLARSRGQARELIDRAAVSVDSRPAGRASQTVPQGAHLEVYAAADPAWVGRAAGKLDGALQAFGVTRGSRMGDCLSVRGRRCLDVGAGTGGFTQVLLQRGAAHVVALDVGHGQLVPALARDPRVTERSGVSIRDVGADAVVGPAELGAPFDVVVADLSFISLRLVLPALVPLVSRDGDAVLLIKPQFEVGRVGLTKHGVVKNAGLSANALSAVLEAAAALGWQVHDVVPSSVTGAAGNQEYLGWFSPRSNGAMSAQDIMEAVNVVTVPCHATAQSLEGRGS
ncbi:MAG: TlyA family RNA methyltransferase [Micrococcales bacterium]|nr:TlyA family RNA methyltransferase [Micrococcales bacterium]